MLYDKLNTKYISNLLSVIYKPEKDKYIYLIMELGDLNTIMLKDEEEDFNYRHNKKLLEFIFILYKDEYFKDFQNFEEIFQKENYIKDSNLIFPMINYNSIKFQAKKIFMKIIFKEILKGIKYIHSIGISHRDIKPENIVYSSKEKCCKIIDFSISILLDTNYINDKINNDNLTTKEPGGSIHFQAPEQYEIKSHNPFLSDIWSLGITIFIFLFEIYPFDCTSDSELELQINICNQKLSFPEYAYDLDDNNNKDNNVINFIESILEKDFSKRLSLDEIEKKLDKL
jgi:serine/threonine protein kinase